MTPSPGTTVPEPLVRAEHLDRSFGDRQVLRDLSVDLPREGTVGLVGRNGVGKTTLMGILAGQLRETGGRVTVDGHRPFDNPVVTNQVCFTGVDILYPPQWSVDTVLSVAAQRYPAGTAPWPRTSQDGSDSAGSAACRRSRPGRGRWWASSSGWRPGRR